MQWLRMRPDTAEDLDRVDHKGRWIQDDEFDEESEHDERGRHTSSLFEGADDEEDDDEEEEEEDEPAQQQPPPHSSGRPGARQRAGAPQLGSTAATVDAEDSDSDADSDTSFMAIPRIPPRYQKYFRYRKPAPSPPPARVAETDTDSGLVSSTSCSSSALETPREELPRPVVAPIKGKMVLRTFVPGLNAGLEASSMLHQLNF
ncbi:hypothetical protein FRB90_010816 [Tulasnella sp. 427]|nr:hypothetical protein FRB90_010816 [Tulasnella sp. 427]